MRRVFPLLVVLALAVTGCGGDDADDDGTGASMRIVGASEFEFDRDVVEVEAGRETVVDLRNRGSLEHTWTVLKAGVTVASADAVTDGDVLVSISADAAQSASARFVAPEPGEYQIICMIEGHLQAGMAATLVSTGPA